MALCIVGYLSWYCALGRRGLRPRLIGDSGGGRFTGRDIPN